MKPPVPFKWKGNHHSYYGIWFIAFGIFNWILAINNLEKAIPIYQAIIGIGIFMLIDDIIEHTVTENTPLRLLFNWFRKKGWL